METGANTPQSEPPVPSEAATNRTWGDGAQLVVSTLSHDLRGPLSTIAALANTLERHGDRLDTDTRRDLLRRISTTAESLGELVGELLDLTRFEGGMVSVRREPTDIRAMAERIAEQLDAGDRISVQIEDLTVEVDPMMLGRILTNLANNALRHAGPDAKVWVRGGHVPGGFEIHVEDDGEGVPSAQREHLFDAFHRSSDSDGTGFGLAAVARFAHLQGGTVSVADRPGGGASFRVWLPDGDESGLEGRPVVPPHHEREPRSL